MTNNEDEKYKDVNSPEGLKLEDTKKKKKKSEDFETYGIEYKKTVVCKHCKEEVPVDSEVCPHCGHFVKSGFKPYTPISRQKAWKIKIVLGIICIIVFIAIVTLANR